MVQNGNCQLSNKAQASTDHPHGLNIKHSHLNYILDIILFVCYVPDMNASHLLLTNTVIKYNNMSGNYATIIK